MQLGWTYFEQERDLDRAYEEFRAAIELRPNNAECKKALEEIIGKQSARRQVEFDDGQVTLDVYINEMLSWAYTVLMFNPPNVALATKFYNSVLELDQSNAIAEEQLRLLHGPATDELAVGNSLADLQLADTANSINDNEEPSVVDHVLPSTLEFYETTRHSEVK